MNENKKRTEICFVQALQFSILKYQYICSTFILTFAPLTITFSKFYVEGMMELTFFHKVLHNENIKLSILQIQYPFRSFENCGRDKTLSKV